MNSGDDGENGAKAAGGDDAANPMLPEWAEKPHLDFVEHSREILDVLHLACSGIPIHRIRPDVIKFLADSDEEGAEPHQDGDDPLESLGDAERQAKLAQQEMDRGFPLLHAQALISCWTALEVFVENLLAAWIENEPSAQEADVIRKLKVRLWEYHEMDAQERSLYTIQLLQREVSGPLTVGITAFEAQLAPFDLAGKVPDDVRKRIFAANHIRNVLVHRRGIIDRRLLKACPWLKLELGQPILLKSHEFGHYSLAIIHYAALVNDRVRVHFGLQSKVPSILTKIAERDSAESNEEKDK